MPNPFDKIAQGYQDAQTSTAKKPQTCANCGQPVDTKSSGNKDDEPLSKKIKRSLGLPDDGAAF